MTTLTSAHPTVDALFPRPAGHRTLLRLVVIGAAAVVALYVALATGNGSAVPAAGVPYAGQLVEQGLPLFGWSPGSSESPCSARSCCSC